MTKCKKCEKEFVPQKGLISFCSLKCRNSRTWDKDDRLIKSIAAKESLKVKFSNKNWTAERKLNYKKARSPKLFTGDICLYCKKEIFHLKNKTRTYHINCWRKSSGGYRVNSTKVNRCVYNGVKLDSGLEKFFVILLDKEKIIWWKNSTEYFKYKDKTGKERKYYPDFYLPEYDLWIETKGGRYKDLDKNYNEKINAVKNLEVLFSKDVKNLYKLIV